MKKFVIAALMLALCITLAVPALAEGVRDANAAYNELLAGFNGKYPDEYAGAYVDTSDGDKLCVLLTERHADTAAKLGAALDKMLAHISAAYRDDVKFKTAKYSYNELLAAHDTASALLKEKGYGLSYVGINEMNNAVDVGIIPADHAAAAAFVQADAALSGLPPMRYGCRKAIPIGRRIARCHAAGRRRRSNSACGGIAHMRRNTRRGCIEAETLNTKDSLAPRPRHAAISLLPAVQIRIAQHIVPRGAAWAQCPARLH